MSVGANPCGRPLRCLMSGKLIKKWDYSLGRREGRVAIFDQLRGDFVNKVILARNINYKGISKFTE